MNVLGVIPARGGSRSIPRKNLAPLNGRPLLLYTCEAARQSGRLSRTVLSTDDPDIAEVGRAAGIDVPFLRPADLAADETPMVDVLRHAVQWLEERQAYSADVIVLLQPTSPLRRSEHIDLAVDRLLETGADTVVSVVEVPHQFGPPSLMRLEAGRLVPFVPGPSPLRRQDKPKLYARNGPAVLAIRRSQLEAGHFYGGVVQPLEMTLAESVDIDHAEDLALAEYWLCRRPAGTVGGRRGD